ncbi:hypothetical protein BU23DRAFT_254159 [Bimuria novae-zelandiae CBS 107.79]|uniref:Uncharacterized protein n=1 Tax=Bimuria novae-zelandiae CBS 107.79 TaxID=1447943 RepID=A0A6A5VMY6_9PLEO|nr:hypothetical protein BU23DRAFT_254159 [Bimuria novae-zelandiae CBS 107.79]
MSRSTIGPLVGELFIFVLDVRRVLCLDGLHGTRLARPSSVLGSLAPDLTLDCLCGPSLVLGKTKMLPLSTHCCAATVGQEQPYRHTIPSRVPATTQNIKGTPARSVSISIIPDAMRQLPFEPGRAGAGHSSSTVLVQAVPHASDSEQRGERQGLLLVDAVIPALHCCSPIPAWALIRT